MGMFIYNNIIIGPWFRRVVIPKLGQNRFALFCTSCWGLDMEDGQQHLISNEIGEDNEDE